MNDQNTKPVGVPAVLLDEKGSKMKRNLAFIALVVVTITILLFTGQSLAHRFGMQAGKLGAGDVTGAVAPDFELDLVDAKGKTIKLSDLKGKAVLLNFWATWCEPCKIEMPWLVELQDKYRKDGFESVGVAMDDSGQKEIAEFARKMKVNYTVVIGSEKVADLYGGLDGLPTNFFLDRNGKVIDSFKGLRSESVIVDDIKKALASESKNAALIH